MKYKVFDTSLKIIKDLFIDDIQNISRIAFKPSINTLRAVSVTGVLLYHFEYHIFEGGWLGVDVFFVISGYLISNILFSELNNENFKFRSFFKRRIKRIIPSLLLTTFLSLAIGYSILNPLLLNQLAETIRSGIFFYSNYFFSTLDFYTGGGVSKVFLLNFWSLSVEEQYYLIFPLILYFGYKFKNKYYIVSFLVFIGIYSFFINSIDDLNKFYFLQFRAWEFLVGVFINFIKEFRLRYISEISLLVILLSFFIFDETSIIQIEPKILVVFFTAIFINNKSSSFIDKVSSNKLLTAVGVSSYTIYLLHYPLYNFYKHYLEINFKEISAIEKIVLMVIILLVSSFIYNNFEKKFIENFNKKRQIYLFILFSFNVFFIVLFLNTNFLRDSQYSKFSSIPEKVYRYSIQKEFEPYQNNARCHNRDILDRCYFEANKKSEEVIYFIGDSQLLNLSYNLIQNPYFDSYNKTIYTKAGCIAVLSKNSCPDTSQENVNQFLNEIKNSTIIYGGRVPLYISDGNFYNGTTSRYDAEYHKRDMRQFSETIIKFLENENKVYFLYSIPNQAWNVTDLYFNGNFSWGELIGYDYEYWYQKIEDPIAIVSGIESPNFYAIDSYKIFCNEIYLDYCVAAYDDNIFYSDYSHLTNEGSDLIIKEIIKKFDS